MPCLLKWNKLAAIIYAHVKKLIIVRYLNDLKKVINIWNITSEPLSCIVNHVSNEHIFPPFSFTKPCVFSKSNIFIVFLKIMDTQKQKITSEFHFVFFENEKAKHTIYRIEKHVKRIFTILWLLLFLGLLMAPIWNIRFDSKNNAATVLYIKL